MSKEEVKTSKEPKQEYDKQASGDPKAEKGGSEKAEIGEDPNQAFEEEESEQGESYKSK